MWQYTAKCTKLNKYIYWNKPSKLVQRLMILYPNKEGKLGVELGGVINFTWNSTPLVNLRMSCFHL